MTQQSNETKISFRIDPNSAAQVRRELTRTFDTKLLRSFTSGLDGMAGSIHKITAAHMRLGQSMRREIAQGAQEWQNLAEEAERAAQRIKRAFSHGFFQGFAPNIGQFLESNEKGVMARQMAGQYAGSAIRGGIGRGVNAASGMLGGQGPLTTMFGNIPFIGGAASQAEAMAGSALSFYQARFQASPFLGGAEARFIPGQQGGFTGDRGEAAGRERAALMGNLADRSNAMRERLMRERGMDFSTAEQVATQWADRYGGGAQMRKDRPDLVLGAQDATPSRNVLTNDPTKGYSGVGQKIGLDATASIQLAGQLAQSIGGRGAMSTDRFSQILGAQTMGVDSGAAAGLFRQLQPGRGGTTADPQNILGRVIGDALAQGLENSEITEYLETIASVQEAASQNGIQISTEGFSRLAGAFSGMGIQGMQASRLASQFTQAPLNVASRGVNGPVDVQMARAFGYDPSKPGSYIGALRAMEKAPNSPEAMQSFIQKITAGTSGDEGSFVLRRALGQMGINTSFEQADKLMSGDFSELPSKAADLGGQLDSPVVKALAGPLQAQAGVQNELLAAGRNMLPIVQQIQGDAAKLSSTISKWAPQLKDISDMVGEGSLQIRELLDLLRALVSRQAP